MTMLCTCCKAEINAPVFVNYKPYGYSCAAKVGYNGKRGKKLPKAEAIRKIVSLNNGSTRCIITLESGERIAGYSAINTETPVISTIGKVDFETYNFYRATPIRL